MQSPKLSGALAVVFLLAISLPLRADYLTLYPGPAFDWETKNGYQFGSSQIWANNGSSLGTFAKWVNGVNKGARVLRWDTSGAITEFGQLGTLPNGNTGGEMTDFNSAGFAGGSVDKYVAGVDKGSRAVRWSASGEVTELGTLGLSLDGGTAASVFAINSTGTAVGFSSKWMNGNFITRAAVRWSPSGAATQLGNLGGESFAYGVNDAGTAVGYSEKNMGIAQGERAVRWEASTTTPTELATLGTTSIGSGSAIALHINNAGTAIGNSDKLVNGIDLGNRAVMWAAGKTTVTELPNLGVSSSGYTTGGTRDINDAGIIVGDMDKYVGGVFKGTRAVKWNALGTTVTELGLLGTDDTGFTYSAAYSINASGLIVGSAFKYNDPRYNGDHAVVWGPENVPLDLNNFIDPASGWMFLSYAWNIDDNNWVTGQGTFDVDGPGPKQPYERSFLIQVPEPASFWLIAVSMLALARRRQTSRC